MGNCAMQMQGLVAESGHGEWRATVVPTWQVSKELVKQMGEQNSMEQSATVAQAGACSAARVPRTAVEVGPR